VRLRNRPLIVDGLDADLYVGRPTLEKALRDALVDERNVLLTGERRSGKTTLLRKVMGELPPERKVVTVDGTLASTPTALLQLTARALGAPPDASPRERLHDDGDAMALLDEVDRVPRRPGTVVVVEGPLDAEVAYTVFGRLRDQLWRLPSTWVTTATPDGVGALRTPPADAFWSLVLEVPPMDSREIEELLSRALEPDERDNVDAASDRPLRATPGQVVRWAQDVLDGIALPERSREVELERSAHSLGWQASMALAELRALGRPASAGDPELLARLGWTRANAARWLARMEGKGILRSFTGMPQGQGRPPKLYEPAR
jgi:energy-coupling factor transporter ATP-binding protein EcfA2